LLDDVKNIANMSPFQGSVRDIRLPRIFTAVPRSLIWAVAISIALHSAMLLGSFRPLASSGFALPVSTTQVRLVLEGALVGGATQQVSATPAVTAPVAAAPALVPAAVAAPTESVVGESPVPGTEKLSQPAVKSGLTPAPAYQSAAGLDPPPRLMQDIDPEYPAAARLQEGFVVLRLLISSSGDVDEVAVVRATPPGVFDAAALAAWTKAKFSPGYFLGIPVKSQMLIQVDFTPINRGASVSGQNR
jgi:protein TonB